MHRAPRAPRAPRSPRPRGSGLGRSSGRAGKRGGQRGKVVDGDGPFSAFVEKQNCGVSGGCANFAGCGGCGVRVPVIFAAYVSSLFLFSFAVIGRRPFGDFV